MLRTEWDEQMKLDLIRLKSELNGNSFKVLSKGLGFGKFEVRETFTTSRPEEPRSQIHESWQPLRNPNRPIELPSQKTTVTNDFPPTAYPQSVRPPIRKNLIKNTKNPKKDIFYKFLKVHLIDIVVVTVTLFVVLSGIGFALEGERLIWDWQNFQLWLPVRLLEQTSWNLIIAGVYSVFAVYLLFFKIIVGATLGESFISSHQEADLMNRSL